jgi:hypothetical protein
MNVKLLAPTYQKETILKVQFGALLPAYLLPLVSNVDHVTKITITPHKAPELAAAATLCRVYIEAPANLRDGNLGLQNLGRVPATVPAPTLDDLRPETFLVWGKGSQIFRVVLQSNHNIYVNLVVAF